MQEDTTITLIKQSIQNFEETKDVEHLNDIIQIIFEYKKKPATALADSQNNIFTLFYHNDSSMKREENKWQLECGEKSE